ncbi:MAG: peptidylprolyl isomerase [Actinobacteria bacterium]|nr:peptidylprolyl isomerase [Actinomycetota bacterium]
MRRKGSILIAVIVCMTVVLLVVGGCGKSKKEAEKPEEPAGTTSAGMTQSSGAQFGPDGTPVKTLGSFPDGQDGANVQAVIKTDKGDIVLEFYPDVAPVTVASFLHLARTGFYNGTSFHRVEPGFVIQGGDPKSKDPNATDVGTGGPGYYLPAEFSSRKHETGTLAMARSSSPSSGGSQFYICLAPQPDLDGQYTVFGKVVSGMEVVNSIQRGDVIREVVIMPKVGA